MNSVMFLLGIGYLEGTFSFQVKEWHLALPGIPQEDSICTPGTLEKMLERLQKQQIIVSPGHG